MRLSAMRQIGITAVAGSLLIVSGTAPLTLAGTSPVQVLGVATADRAAGVTLTNSSRNAQTGTLIIEVQIGDQHALMQQRFKVSGGNKVWVSLTPLGKRGKIVQVGVIVDDGAPF